MFMRFPRTNPTKAMFALSAAAIPDESTAAIEATIGKPAFAAAGNYASRVPTA